MVSDSFRVNQIRFRPAFHPDPAGTWSLQCPPDLLAGLRAPPSLLLRGGDGGEGEGKGKRKGRNGNRETGPLRIFMDPPLMRMVCFQRNYLQWLTRFTAVVDLAEISPEKPQHWHGDDSHAVHGSRSASAGRVHTASVVGARRRSLSSVSVSPSSSLPHV